MSLFQQSQPAMTARRITFLTLFIASFAALTVLMAVTLSPNGYGVLDFLVLGCFIVTLPWTIIGFWNAVIGLAVMRLSRDPARMVCPIDAGDLSAALTSRTAILSCVRNEDVSRLEKTLNAMLANLVRSGESSAFTLFVLSDSFEDEIVQAEQVLADRLAKRWSNKIAIVYRRREDNPGYKAGNIEDFCDRWGKDYDFALVLDADSYMSAEAMLGLVRRMEANPKLGILQSLVVGLPTDSAFARIFQFGMRLGMRSYTIGSAWWQGDCGPYWGHNAVLRIKPFIEHCRLPQLPGKGPLSGWILSHDQVEAVMMRRAGYEVRVLPQEGGSYEENPPHLLEFIRRDLRWCQGNLQYKRLLNMPGLKPVSRIQLVLAILMFIGSPAWVGFMVSAAWLGMADTGAAPYRADTGAAIFLIIMTMVFAPKLATIADILIRADLRRAFGGFFRVIISSAGEILYAAMLAPIMAVAHTLFIGGLIFGKTIGWGAQGRDLERLPLGLTARKLWPQTLFGLAAMAWISQQPFALVWPVLPIAVGPLLAIPAAILTSTHVLGLAGIKSTLWRIPEESDPPAELWALALPALAEREFAGAIESWDDVPVNGEPVPVPIPVEA
ncbi:glucans biosynthesis glucosyltransferase MdoH [uncultured Roseibium sp.]|uniref:glucans biosynthesis glucosyltransferase MdoH n=1 Tax=uncultured Roseibium sp. TaxID=1936171 RepID=UPI0037492B7A